MYATRHMRVLLRAKMPFFNSWGLELLIPQVENPRTTHQQLNFKNTLYQFACVLYYIPPLPSSPLLLPSSSPPPPLLSYRPSPSLFLLPSSYPLSPHKLYDLDNQVALEAVDILDEACEEEVRKTCTFLLCPLANVDKIIAWYSDRVHMCVPSMHLKSCDKLVSSTSVFSHCK